MWWTVDVYMTHVHCTIVSGLLLGVSTKGKLLLPEERSLLEERKTVEEMSLTEERKTMERKERVQRRMILRRFLILCSITPNQFLNDWSIKLFWSGVLMVWHRILMKAFIPWFGIFVQKRLSVDVLLLRLQSAWQLHSSIMDIPVMQECWSACMSPLAATRSLPLSGLIIIGCWSLCSSLCS